MQVVVCTRIPLQHGAASTRALLIEGFEVIEIVMEDNTHYGRVIQSLWEQRRGFVLVDEDVVPWPGAIDAMLDCAHPMCCYQHPRLSTDEGQWATGLGCAKFSTALVQKYKLVIPECRFDEVNRPMNEQLHNETWHIHYPPVAHVKASAVKMVRV